jgi:hypothetical protein
MELMAFIWENALILIPALIIIGAFLKESKILPDQYIPLILLPCGVTGTVLITGFSASSVIQGILVAGAAVYGNQIVKQLRKKE